MLKVKYFLFKLFLFVVIFLAPFIILEKWFVYRAETSIGTSDLHPGYKSDIREYSSTEKGIIEDFGTIDLLGLKMENVLYKLTLKTQTNIELDTVEKGKISIAAKNFCNDVERLNEPLDLDKSYTYKEKTRLADLKNEIEASDCFNFLTLNEGETLTVEKAVAKSRIYWKGRPTIVHYWLLYFILLGVVVGVIRVSKEIVRILKNDIRYF